MISFELEMLPKCSSMQCAISEISWIISVPWSFQNLLVECGETQLLECRLFEKSIPTTIL